MNEILRIIIILFDGPNALNAIFTSALALFLCKQFLVKYTIVQKLMITVGVSIIVARFWWYIYLPCENSDKLTSLYFTAQDLLHAIEVSFVPCFGTLLGIHRDGKMIPWEYDIDFCLTEDMCKRVYENKSVIESAMVAVYRAQEILPWYMHRDGHLFADNRFTRPCARIYVGAEMIDLYHWVPTTLGELKLMRLGLHKIRDKNLSDEYYTKWSDEVISSASKLGVGDDEQLFCASEKCFLPKNIFPYTTDTFMGRNMSLVSNPDAILQKMYGSDWKTPLIKGFKHHYCRISPWWFWFFGLVLIFDAISWSPSILLKRHYVNNMQGDATADDSHEQIELLKVN